MRSAALEHFRGLGDFPAAGHRDGAERARPRLSILPGGNRERGRRREDFLLDVRTFRAREVLPLVLELHRGVDVGDFLGLDDRVDYFLNERLLLVLRNLARIFLERARPILGIRWHRRKLHVHPLGDRARLGDFGCHPGDPADLILGDDRAAGKAPNAAVDDAHAEPGGATRARGTAASEPAESAAAATPAASAASAASASAKSATEVFEVAVAAGGVDAAVRVSREPDVCVAAALRLGFEKGDVREALELRFEDLALRRLSNQVTDDVAGGDRHARHRDGFDKVSAFHE